MFKLTILLLGVVALSHQKDLGRKIVPYKDIPRGRIEGGTEAEPNSWPWQGWITSASGSTVNCGAVLVNAGWIMTAAHCLDGYASTRATFGDHDTTVDEGFEQQKSILSDQFVSPASYNFPEYDIALINMESDPYELTAQVAAVELTRTTPQAGTDATLTGWGRTSKGGPISDVLKQAVLQIRESSVCNTFYNMGDQNDRFLICLEDDEGVDSSCNGDSGGALNIQEDGVWRVGGVTSYGSAGTCAGAPVGYSSTNKHACWLEANNNGAFEAYGDPVYNNC